MAMNVLTRWHGVVTALLLGALVLVVLTTDNAVPADEEASAAALPPDLAKIPSDGLFLLSGRVADLWNSEQFKSAREKFKQEIDEGAIKVFQERFGLPLEQVERMTLLILTPPPHGEPLLFVRTVKPYDLAKLVALAKHAKVKKYKDEMLYIGDKDWTIYPIDNRSLVYGELREVNALIDHPQPKPQGHL